MLASSRPLRAFLCHFSGDKQKVRELHRRLRADGFAPWLDEEDLLPGQDWQQKINEAVRSTDVVIVCLSYGSINKAGFVQKEIKLALDAADEQPENTIFIIPLKLEKCDIPERLCRWHGVNLFEENGYERLVSSLQYRAKSLGIDIADENIKSSKERPIYATSEKLIPTDLKDALPQSSDTEVDKIPEGFFQKSFNTILKTYKSAAKDFFLLTAATSLLLINTLLARQVFISLNLFTKEENLFTPNFLGEQVSIDYPLIYGLFLTIIVTLFLNLSWSREKIKNVIGEGVWMFFAALIFLFAFLALRIQTVVKPSSSQVIIDLLVLFSWIAGVLAIYWLVGEVIGNEENYTKMLIALMSPAMLFLLTILSIVIIIKRIVSMERRA